MKRPPTLGAAAPNRTLAPASEQPAAAWRIGPLRRFTRNLLLPVTLAGRPYMIKFTRNRDEAAAEIAGHHLLRPHYRVPALHASVRVPGGRVLLYEQLPIGPDSGLFLDLLNRPPGRALDDYLADLTRAYLTTIETTLVQLPLSGTVGKLYRERALAGGRLDTYYPDDVTVFGSLTTGDLAKTTIIINGCPLRLDWPQLLDELRGYFAADPPVWAALTQGDPTDVNLAHPLAWLDYDTAGLNSLAGEFANFLWYTTTLGGWLVPTYNPAAFTDHPATFTQLRRHVPLLRRADYDRGSQTLHLDYDVTPHPARRRAARLYYNRLVRPLAARLWADRDLGQLLRPWLLMRILAVYNLGDLNPDDRLLTIGRLAEAAAPDFDPVRFFHLEDPCPAR